MRQAVRSLRRPAAAASRRTRRCWVGARHLRSGSSVRASVLSASTSTANRAVTGLRRATYACRGRVEGRLGATTTRTRGLRWTSSTSACRSGGGGHRRPRHQPTDVGSVCVGTDPAVAQGHPGSRPTSTASASDPGEGTESWVQTSIRREAAPAHRRRQPRGGHGGVARMLRR